MIAILGCHRSGTSCITGMIADQGFYLGKVNRKASDNLKGNLENPHIVELNDKILEYNNGTWFNPPKGLLIWNEKHIIQRNSILKQYPPDSVIKDPRFLLTLDFWNSCNFKYIGVIRNKDSVVKSLISTNRKRSIIDKIAAENIWKIYNSKLLELNIPIIDFDKPLERQIIKALEFYGFKSDNKFKFFDKKLVHYKNND